MAGGQHDISIVSWTVFGTPAHELAHALGYWHEQSRTDRDAYVQIEWGNVSQTACDGPCDSQFQTRGAGGEYGPYDFDSVMHYGACAFSCCQDTSPCQPVACSATSSLCRTITVLPPFDVDWQDDIGQRDHLSAFDALTMSFLYPLPDWRFVDLTYSGTESGTFLEPYNTFAEGYDAAPAGGGLWLLQAGTHVTGGTLTKAMLIQAPLSGVILVH